MKTLLFLSLAGAVCSQSGGPWSITSSTLDGGGSTSTGGSWTLTGTIGQPEATTVPASGGIFSLAGGFWPGTGAPPNAIMLTIAAGAAFGHPGTMRVSWPEQAAGYQLQSSENLTRWDDLGPPITGANHAYFSMTNLPHHFFRLKKL